MEKVYYSTVSRSITPVSAPLTGVVRTDCFDAKHARAATATARELCSHAPKPKKIQ